VNFFQPVEKLVTKTRQGARSHRVYDRAQTPYQRLCAADVLAPDGRRELEALSTSVASAEGASSATAFGPTSARRWRASSLVKPVGPRGAVTVS
jgi:hypothetical protein